MNALFDHEKLQAYQEALGFVSWADGILQRIAKTLAVSNQLDRASTSIPLNIAEGNGKYTPSDRCRFFDTARGSVLECAACLDVLAAKKIMTAEEIQPGKEKLRKIVSMLVGLIRSNSPDRLHEDLACYVAEEKKD